MFNETTVAYVAMALSCLMSVGETNWVLMCNLSVRKTSGSTIILSSLQTQRSALLRGSYEREGSLAPPQNPIRVTYIAKDLFQ